MSDNTAASLRTRLVGGFNRRLGLLHRAMTLGVRAAVFDSNGRVFLVRHTYVDGFYLPGGAVERGEDALTALARELEEEGNIRLVGAPELHGLYWNVGRDHVALYVVREFSQDAPKAADLEIAESGFYAIDDLPAGTTRATRARLDELFNGASCSARW
jgi:ADP-ribose pyrophosphatase YjhB (NUDIX family)